MIVIIVIIVVIIILLLLLLMLHVTSPSLIFIPLFSYVLEAEIDVCSLYY